jgi:hypothetical protein
MVLIFRNRHDACQFGDEIEEPLKILLCRIAAAARQQRIILLGLCVPSQARKPDSDSRALAGK